MEAIILKKVPIKEFDQLVVCYSKDSGKIACVAKSALRPASKQAGHLDLLNLVSFSPIQKNGLPIITSAHALKSFGALKSSLPAMAVASILLEIFDRFVFENDADEKLWRFLNDKLEALDSASRKPVVAVSWQDIFRKTQTEISDVLGYGNSANLEELAQAPLASLQFARKVIKY